MLDCLRSLNLPAADLTFFEVHANLEPSHLAEAEELVAAHALDNEQNAILEWQKTRLKSHWEAFWKGIREACEAAIAGNTRPSAPWRLEPVFSRLCDLVASDRLVCLTGTGVSAKVPRASEGRPLPSWPQLIRELRDVVYSSVDPAALREVDEILDSVWPSGRLLIQAAALLREASPEKFDEALLSAVTSKPGATSDTHLALCGLRPRGVMTFNYDSAHEAAAEGAGFEYKVLTPAVEDQQEVVNVLADGFSVPFLLKAHGSIGRPSDSLILTAESYRELVVRRPAYRALVQHIFTEFHLLIVGFGMSDPDFDLLIDTLVDAYGAPIRDSVVIRHRREEGPGEVLLRRRYGISTLYVDSFADIPRILNDACSWPGPAMSAALSRSLSSGSTDERSKAHAELRLLGPAGRALASATLRRELEGAIETGAEPKADFRTSELVYTLGVLTERMNGVAERQDWDRNKVVIMKVVSQSFSPDPIARALTVLRPLLRPEDLQQVSVWQARFRSPPFVEAAHQRLAIYADYLQVYVPAKYDSEPRGLGAQVTPN
jgi:hypothetical protein